MSNDLRRGRGRPTALALAAIALTLLTPAATAQSAPEIILPDTAPAPGETFVAVFRVPGSALDLSVQDHLVCELIGAAEMIAACDQRGDVVTVRVMPTAVEYVLALTAPDSAGDFTLRITRAPLADSPLLAATAEATLAVRAAPIDEPLEPGDDQRPGGGATNIWNIFVDRDPGDADDPPEEDGERWMVSSTAGSAALFALVVAGRKGGSR